MALSATIVLLSQDMDLDDGSMTNFVVLRLPNGQSIRALITDEAAQKIVELTLGSSFDEPSTPRPSDTAASTPLFSMEQRGDAEVRVFGGSAAAPEMGNGAHLSETDSEVDEEDAGQI